jgi:hypothetical protein
MFSSFPLVPPPRGLHEEERAFVEHEPLVFLHGNVDEVPVLRELYNTSVKVAVRPAAVKGTSV